MKKRLLVGIALSVLMLIGVLSCVEWGAVVRAWSTVSWPLLVVALAIKWIVVDLKSSRWAIAIESSQESSTGARTTASRRAVRAASLLGFAGNIFLPARLGDVARVTYLSHKLSIPLATMVSSASLGPVLDLMAITLSLLLLIGTSVGTLVNPGVAIVTFIGLLGAWIMMIVIARSDDNRFANNCGSLGRLVYSLQMRFRGLRTGLQAVREVRSFCMMAIQTCAIVVAEYLAIAIALRAFGLPDFWPIPLALVTALNLSFAFNLTPGNIGPHQLVCTLVLGLFRVPASEAVAFSVAFQGSVHLLVVLSALIVLLREGKTSSHRNRTMDSYPVIQPEESLSP